jgi:hypothetical protein
MAHLASHSVFQNHATLGFYRLEEKVSGSEEEYIGTLDKNSAELKKIAAYIFTR